MGVTWHRRALASACVVGALGGCAADDGSATWGPLTVVEAPEGGADALASGVIDITDDCVYLRMEGARTEDALLLVWPDERTTWNGEERTITFKDPENGTVEVADGDDVGVGGGSGMRPSDQLVAGSVEACAADVYWWVSGMSATAPAP